MPLDKLEAIAHALSARVDLRLSWNGEALDRVLDAGHAVLVERTAALLRAAGWEVAIEVTFFVRGERGAIDILAWHPGARIVLIVEVKSVVPDIQSMLAAVDRKVRLAPLIAAERGWSPVAVGKLLVIEATRTSRRRIGLLPEIFDAAFPDRGVACRRWVKAPSADPRPLRGLLFVSSAQGVTTRHRTPGLRQPRAA